MGRSADLVEGSLARIAKHDPWVRAFAWIDPERARRLAAEADRLEARSPLHGVPVGVKDIIDTAGIPTEHGSALYRGRVPEVGAPAVSALERAGAIMIGKTVSSELAYFTPGPTANPWNRRRTPGGSSMGSAAAVAAGMVRLAVGTQTNGSLIRPAAFCGVVAFKPSRGVISTEGMLHFSETLDTPGALATTVTLAATLVAVMAGDHIQDWTPEEIIAPRFALARPPGFKSAEPAARRRFEQDVARLRLAGARVEEPALPPGLEGAIPAHRAIMAVEAHQNLGLDVYARPTLVSRRLLDLLEEGAATSREGYGDALAVRADLIDAFVEWAEPFDAVLTLPTLGEAPSIKSTGDPVFCTPWSLLGTPAITIPTGLGPHKLPLGLQLVAPPGADRRLVSAARWAEANTPFPAAALP